MDLVVHKEAIFGAWGEGRVGIRYDFDEHHAVDVVHADACMEGEKLRLYMSSKLGCAGRASKCEL